MKRNLTVLMTLAIVATIAFVNVRVAFNKKATVLSLFSIETAQADDPYEQGPMGTNWQTYWTNCTKTTKDCYTITIQPAGVGGSYQHCTTTTYVVNMAICGYGAGFCTSSSGC